MKDGKMNNKEFAEYVRHSWGKYVRVKVLKSGTVRIWLNPDAENSFIPFSCLSDWLKRCSCIPGYKPIVERNFAILATVEKDYSLEDYPRKLAGYYGMYYETHKDMFDLYCVSLRIEKEK